MQPTSPAEVRDQVERMLASQTFAGSPRLRAFLQYIVDRTLVGEAGHLKEYAIGVDVFGRDGQYDPRIDSIVRVEAGRLRAKVDEYYAGEGAGDPVIVRIPRGSYVPHFDTNGAVDSVSTEAPVAVPVPAAELPPLAPRSRWMVALAPMIAIAAVSALIVWPREQTPPPRPSTGISVAVLPFTHYAPEGSDELLAAQITDGVTSELARINAVNVISRTSALQVAGARRPLPEIASVLNASAVVEGSVLTDGAIIRVRTRIVDGSTDFKSAVRDFEGRRDDVDALQRRIASALSATFQARALQ